MQGSQTVNTAILSAIVNSDSLPSMPAVAFKVLELSRQDDVSIQDVATVIAKDPALTAKMMKVSNSSLFGMSKKVATIEQAMMILGMRTVKIMALGFSLVETFNRDTGVGFDYPKYWRRSLSTAVAARQLAGVLGDARRDEAFVGGLLCDVGMIAAEQHPQQIYRPVINAHRSDGGRIHDIEHDLLDITHAQISAMMLANWSMPETLCQAVQAHHGEGFAALEPRTKVLAGVLWAASEISELFCGDIEPADFVGVWDRVVSLVGISSDALDEVLDALNGNVKEAAELFSIELGAAISYDQIRQGAMAQLANLSLSAEHERAVAESRALQAQTQVATLSEQNARLKVDAQTDGLTGIANRSSFDEHLALAIDLATEKQGDLGLILLDLDHFKQLNDTYGHQAGDETLRLVGRCLNKITDDLRFTARYGGEEFAIVATNATARELRELAEDIRKAVSRIRFQHGNKELSVTASLGAAHVSFAEEMIDPEEIIRRADECLYDAKQDGRNRVEITF